MLRKFRFASGTPKFLEMLITFQWTSGIDLVLETIPVMTVFVGLGWLGPTMMTLCPTMVMSDPTIMMSGTTMMMLGPTIMQ